MDAEVLVHCSIDQSWRLIAGVAARMLKGKETGSSLLYVVKSGKIAPNKDRNTEFAAKTEAAKIT